jgi:hypothetical protein
MHSHDPNKDQDQFRKEIAAILEGTSAYHRPKDKSDFFQFVFPAANFRGARFTQGANFYETVFGPRKDEAEDKAVQNVPAVADFRAARFERPEKVRFYRVNQDSPQGLRIRLTDANVEHVQLVDVRWHHEGRRMVIQDELDVTLSSKSGRAQGQQEQREASYELVAIAYRQLINNFQKARAYDLAEDCWCGAMEMKRRDPAQSFVSRAMVNLYRFASFYGSSYQRALAVLGGGLLVFGLLFSLVGLAPNVGKSVLWPEGLVHSLEVATFQSNTHSMATNGLAWSMELLERMFVPAQLSLFLLALRRRFRR